MMTTVTEMRREATHAGYPSGPARVEMPVELIEDDGLGQAWLNLSSGWLKIIAIKNLWNIDEPSIGGWPSIRMHFRAITEDGQRLALSQDLLDGTWYQQSTLTSHAGSSG